MNIQPLIDAFHRKLSTGDCKDKGCEIYKTRRGPSVLVNDCIKCVEDNDIKQAEEDE